MKTVKLSARLQALADMVSKGNRICDVGCDHGWVSIYLIQTEIASKVFAMDVRKGPLERAKEHIQQYHLETYIETRLSDGLHNLQQGEADAMVCAGMGGPLMIKILTEGREKAKAMKELILQPQSEIAMFRKFLRENGYRIVEENMILEEGKFYPMMRVVPIEEIQVSEDSENQDIWDAYGELLLKQKNPVLEQYLYKGKEQAEELLHHLLEQNTGLVRIEELKEEMHRLNKAIRFYSMEYHNYFGEVCCNDYSNN